MRKRKNSVAAHGWRLVVPAVLAAVLVLGIVAIPPVSAQSTEAALSPEAERAFRALVLLSRIFQIFRRDREPVPLADLARESRLPQGVADELVRWLERSQLVVKERGPRERYVPARPLDSITLAEALAALGVLPALSVPGSRFEHPALAALFGEADTAAAARLGETTIAALGGMSDEKPSEEAAVAELGAADKPAG